jgi:CRISPR-associated protein Cas1
MLNVLYVQTQGAYLQLDHDTVRVTVEKQTRLRVPLLRLQGIVAFGQVSISPFLIQRCAEDGRSVAWLDRRGRFAARVEGPIRGNVLLRHAQHLAVASPDRSLAIARPIVAAKIQNSRRVLLRGARDSRDLDVRQQLALAAEYLAGIIEALRADSSVDVIRGREGDAARRYFGVFDHLIHAPDDQFSLDGRTRRPPRDRVNATLSFLYSLARVECESACQSVGMDPQAGFLHAMRPGRPALALDLLEELRAPLADRLTLNLINRRQLRPEHFEELPGGAVHLNDDGRRVVLTAYQKHKEDPVEHRLLEQRCPLGLVPHIQARLLARHLRGDLAIYPAFTHRG